MIAIHQSQFLPWVPYFYKILKADSFVILDDVQFQKNGIQNRNQIKTSQGLNWLTVPVRNKLGQKINEIEIVNPNRLSKVLKTLEQSYSKAKYSEEILNELKEVFFSQPIKLHKLNIDLITRFLKLLKVDKNIVQSSSLNTTLAKDDLVIEIIKKSGDNEYLSGKGAIDYMDLSKFKKANIKVYVMDFEYKPYTQLWEKKYGFIPNLSLLDLLMNDLENSYPYITNNGKFERVK